MESSHQSRMGLSSEPACGAGPRQPEGQSQTSELKQQGAAAKQDHKQQTPPARMCSSKRYVVGVGGNKQPEQRWRQRANKRSQRGMGNVEAPRRSGLIPAIHFERLVALRVQGERSKPGKSPINQ